jgi:hypothetical protein
LGKMNLCALPQLTDCPSKETFRRSSVRHLDAGVSDLQQFCQVHRVTKAAVAKTAWALLLSRFTGTDSVGMCFVDAQPGIYTATVDFTTIDKGITVVQMLEEMDSKVPMIQGYQRSFLSQMPEALSEAGLLPLDNVLVLQQGGDAQTGDGLMEEKLEVKMSSAETDTVY